MANEWHMIQIRIGQRLRNQIKGLSEKYGYSNADITRGALELGIQITAKLFDAQEVMVKEYINLLKKQNRKRMSSVKANRDILIDSEGDSDVISE